MAVKCDEYNGVCVLTVVGDLAGDDVATARRLVDEMVDRRQVADVVVDLEKVPFVDSQGLEALCWIKQRCEDLFGQMKLANPDENVRKILEITRLAHRFETHAELSAALKNMR